MRDTPKLDFNRNAGQCPRPTLYCLNVALLLHYRGKS
jgi:hypothetical protein